MNLNKTPSSDRIHIGIFGKRNAGKSSIINALTGQNLAIVSDVKGTTTDPVLKSMELLPLGPVVIIDTPGLDDLGTLGNLRIQKAYQILNKTDIAILVIDGSIGITKEDQQILDRIHKKGIPCITVYNKLDLPNYKCHIKDTEHEISVSTVNHIHINELKNLIATQLPKEDSSHKIVADLINPMDFIVLVVPIDESAPKGRLILPQQQTIRDILERQAISIVVKDTELEELLKKLNPKPNLIITDSQVFETVSQIVPHDIPLTSFSILFARYKGNLQTLVKGAFSLDQLKDNDHVLICEGCTHHRQCNDIGTVKLPGWIEKHTGKKINFSFTSGTEFPVDLSPYQLIVHCGGCMLNDREMKYRIKCAEDANISITNYGIAIAHMKGILKRSIQIFNK